MANNPITQLMNDFGQEVVEKAMLNLGVYRTVNGKKTRAVASDTLRKSLAFRYDNKYKRIDFFAKGKASDYGDFVEQGVNGTRSSVNSPYSFKSGSGGGGGKGMGTMQTAIYNWMKVKRIQPREPNGSFKKFKTPKAKEAAMEGMAFNIMRAIRRRGIPPLFYYRDAVNETLVDFNDKFIEVLKSEITIAIEENLSGTIKV
jgi:hypothetical protein